MQQGFLSNAVLCVTLLVKLVGSQFEGGMPARPLEIACDSRKQKLYRLNRP